MLSSPHCVGRAPVQMVLLPPKLSLVQICNGHQDYLPAPERTLDSFSVVCLPHVPVGTGLHTKSSWCPPSLRDACLDTPPHFPLFGRARKAQTFSFLVGLSRVKHSILIATVRPSHSPLTSSATPGSSTALTMSISVRSFTPFCQEWSSYGGDWWKAPAFLPLGHRAV